MIEKIIRDHLSQRLAVPVLLEEPDDGSASYVVLEKTGGGRENHIYSATIAAQSCGASLYAAAQLNEAVKEAMDSLVELDEITRAELNSDYNYTDRAKKKYRYQAVYDIRHY